MDIPFIVISSIALAIVFMIDLRQKRRRVHVYLPVERKPRR